jgi:hypothetical protein
LVVVWRQVHAGGAEQAPPAPWRAPAGGKEAGWCRLVRGWPSRCSGIGGRWPGSAARTSRVPQPCLAACKARRQLHSLAARRATSRACISRSTSSRSVRPLGVQGRRQQAAQRQASGVRCLMSSLELLLGAACRNRLSTLHTTTPPASGERRPRSEPAACWPTHACCMQHPCRWCARLLRTGAGRGPGAAGGRFACACFGGNR